MTMTATYHTLEPENRIQRSWLNVFNQKEGISMTEHNFIITEKQVLLPELEKFKKATGRAKEWLVAEWQSCLIDESERYIPELQTMGYEVRTESDLLDLAQELDYYYYAPGVIFIK